MDFKNNYKSFFVKLFTTCFGLGYSPIFPGAVGVVFGTIIAYLIHPLSFYNKLIITLVLIVLAIPLAKEAEKLFKKKDSKKIIIDEVIGVLIAIIWFTNLSVVIFILTLLIFGLFDAIKIYPANIFQKLSGGWGVIMDDIISGLYTATTIFVLLKFL